MLCTKASCSKPLHDDFVVCPYCKTPAPVKESSQPATQLVGYCRISGLALGPDTPHFRCQRCRELYQLKFQFEEQPICQDCAQRGGLTRLLQHERDKREKYIDEALEQRFAVLKEVLLTEIKTEIQQQLEIQLAHQETKKKAMETAIQQAVKSRLSGLTGDEGETLSGHAWQQIQAQHQQEQKAIKHAFNQQITDLSAGLEQQIQSLQRLGAVAPEPSPGCAPDQGVKPGVPEQAASVPFTDENFVVIPAGTYLMGENDRQQRVAVQSFELLVTPVTFEQYDWYCEKTGKRKPRDSGWGRGSRPVTQVSYWDAIDFCDWLNEQTGRGYRLPTEAEWEYACRAGTTTRFWYGDQPDLGKMHCSREKIGDAGRSLPVGHFPPNPWGLYDMHGNVWEWCASVYHSQLTGDEEQDASLDRKNDSDRVLRGGAWLYTQALCRSACRYTRWPDGQNNNIGFRLARSLPEED